MQVGSTMILLVRDGAGRPVCGDVCKIIAVYAAMALVEQNGKQFRVMIHDLM